MALLKIILMTVAGFVFFLSPFLPMAIASQIALLSFGFMSGTWIMYLLDMVSFSS